MMKKRTILRFFILATLLLCSSSAWAQGHSYLKTAAGKSLQAELEFHRDPHQTFAVRGDNLVLAGDLPVNVNYDFDYSVLEGQTLTVDGEQQHGGRNLVSIVTSPGEVRVESGTMTINKVTKEGEKAFLEGTYELTLEEGKTLSGEFKLHTQFRDYNLSSLGWVFMLASIAGVWLLAIFCYKKLLFDAE